jgi:hypothetical protein
VCDFQVGELAHIGSGMLTDIPDVKPTIPAFHMCASVGQFGRHSLWTALGPSHYLIFVMNALFYAIVPGILMNYSLSELMMYPAGYYFACVTRDGEKMPAVDKQCLCFPVTFCVNEKIVCIFFSCELYSLSVTTWALFMNSQT